MKDTFSRLFHKHRYMKIAFREKSTANYRYSERLYRCTVCGKERWVDGRYDPLEKREVSLRLEEMEAKKADR